MIQKEVPENLNSSYRMHWLVTDHDGPDFFCESRLSFMFLVTHINNSVFISEYCREVYPLAY